MHSHPELTLARLDRVVAQRLTPALYTPHGEVSLQAWQVDGDGEPVPAAHAVGLETLPGRAAPDYRPFELGQTWGPAWSTTWFRMTGAVETTDGVVELVLDPGWHEGMDGFHGEAMVYRTDGTPVKAIHPNQSWARLTGEGAQPDVLAADGSFTLYLEAAANPMVLKDPAFAPTGLGEKHTAEEFEPYRFRAANVAQFHTEVWELLRDFEVIGGLIREVPQTEPRYWRLVEATERALDVYDQRSPASVRAARTELTEVLDQPAHATAHVISAIGHAHIDSAWLWPIRETRRKVARTVANVLALMDADDDFLYAMSSAQQYQWLQQDQPELFARLKQRVAEGRFIPVGGMWVESDAVMPSGESMIRQITSGQRYFNEHFGIECDGVWLPDSFGYAAGLPQIVRRAGFNWFLTQKIAWGDTNDFPHHSFDWEGHDGSRVFTHFPPVNTYTAGLTAAELHRAQRNFRDHARSSHSLVPFGFGDGGGGPTREMLGRIRRFADLEGSPQVRQVSPSVFFTEAESQYRARGEVPVWRGELYLEFHRGTLTSQLAMKQGNRRAEATLRAVEHLAAAAAVRAGAPYPYTELAEIWQQVLLHQFHDILPGSSIAWVHREARTTYANLLQRLEELATQAAAALTPGEHSTAPPVLTPDTAGGWQVARSASGDVTITEHHEAGSLQGTTAIDNGRLRVLVDRDGYLSSVVDGASGRELVPQAEQLAALVLFRDEPVRWDAWDIDRHTLRLGETLRNPESVEITTDDAGALVTSRRQAGQSSFIQRIRLRPGAAEIEVEVEVDWQDSERMLKAALPLQVHTMHAAFETQYGYLEREVSENTSWQEAQFEVNQHRWLHVSERDLGVGITNDSSYGCDITRRPGGGTMARLSLLRAARFPDPGADLGTHRMRFSLVLGDIPHTVDAAYRINAPSLTGSTEHAGETPACQPLEPLVSLDLDAGYAVIDWVKLADDGSGDVVIRIAEAAGGRARGFLELGAGLRGAQLAETDVLERIKAEGGTLPEDLPYALETTEWVDAATAELTLRPFQLATLRLRTSSGGTV
ncbi:alpha-mannosidase [Nesterenkonia alba]|uniref:alpha-mannosidase n=1 Tax=Nesterenkonia alba TaxID=515814 RepID=UPI0003B571F9|nr:glycoside hydrolase family 38 C-terminal domain-containing protein [Nesterenkonia alba]